ncbi:hypothetical protein FH609_020295 [Streptomyces sp. 3MP-14]|uniref:NUDIX domain-containing protein n=1 Tax=Streptomyces mimosae TaxID=2586635 RepID=A0A5N5ZZ90_9ACTN|nr:MULTISPECIES: hypothetical protein [Streptomyces]KAB8161807.1 hypothetical protein FH607_024125 [Streptomyces mimosae]KAB8174925.1 hypothetical protein FH609_020295 [Streptomyces sp. 3MP-14]
MPQTATDSPSAPSPELPRITRPLTVRVTLLATTRDNHVLMVRDPHIEGGWQLPSGTVPPGDCPVRTARHLSVSQTGYYQEATHALAITLEHGPSGLPIALDYILDGGRTDTPPCDAASLTAGAGWRPMRELLESLPLVQNALLALAHGERVPVLVNGDRPAADWPEPDAEDQSA